MLLSLTLADFVLVDRLSLGIPAGFSVLTGETGAGKSILLDALALVLGERGDAGVVRQGAERAEITAEFDTSQAPALSAWLDENALSDDSAVLIMRRVVDRGGRSRGFINGRPVTVQQLKATGEFLVDIHGQHAHYSLLKAAEQRRMLDAFARAEALVVATAHAWQDLRTAIEREQAALSQHGSMQEERADLVATLEALRAVSFDPENWGLVQDAQRRMSHAAELVQGAQSAVAVLEDDEGSLLSQLKGVRNRLAELTEIDAELRPLLDELETAAVNLQECARGLRRYGERVELNPAALAEAESRIAAVMAVSRKFHVRPEALPELIAQSAARLTELGEAADLEVLTAQVVAARARFDECAGALHARRQQAALDLAAQVTATMQALAMQGGAFSVRLSGSDPGPHGIDEVVFEVAPHAGQDMQPLAKTASGGELSRIGLALQTALSSVSTAPTLIFDEVDAGIGGGVAEIVGRLLAVQGEARQVICVTHLAQVAACARAHFRVSKAATENGVRSVAELLSASERVEEIARMLGGVTLTDATRKHAREMLNHAVKAR